MMKITFDKSANAAYVYLNKSNSAQWGIVKNTVIVDPKETGGMINLDFNDKGQLVGIEIMDADRFLSKDVLDQAEIIG